MTTALVFFSLQTSCMHLSSDHYPTNFLLNTEARSVLILEEDYVAYCNKVGEVHGFGHSQTTKKAVEVAINDARNTLSELDINTIIYNKADGNQEFFQKFVKIEFEAYLCSREVLERIFRSDSRIKMQAEAEVGIDMKMRQQAADYAAQQATMAASATIHSMPPMP